nr:DUF1572 domain-containing protein [uncultured Allomuricauda sp.]
MTKSKNLASRIQEVLLNGKWIANTNLQDQLRKTTWKQANYKIGDHNSIAELTYHINYYVAGILNVLNGGDLEIRDKYSFDMEKIESENDWQNLIQSFISNAHSIIEKISNSSENQWSELFVKEEYGTYQRNIEGLIEHSYYHLGQISLLFKLINKATINT